MESTENWNDDTMHALILHKCTLGLIGVWPPEAETLPATTRWIVAIIIETTTMTSLCTEMYLNCRSFHDMMDGLILLISSGLSLTKILVHRWYRVHSRRLLQSMAHDWSSTQDKFARDTMSSCAEKSRFVSLTLLSMMITAVAIHLVASIPFDVPFAMLNPAVVTIGNHTERSLLVATYCLCHGISSATYYLVFSWQFAQILVQLISHGGSDGFFFSLAMHLCGQFMILGRDFAALDTDYASNRLKIGRLVRRHRRLTTMVDELEAAFNMITLVQLLASALLLCVVGYQVLMCLNIKDNFAAAKQVFTITSFFMELFLYSFGGELLEHHSERLAYTIYDCPWYNFHTKVAKSLQLIILRSAVPSQLTAGKFVSMNLLTFLSILKMSVSYLSVLRMMLEV